MSVSVLFADAVRAAVVAVADDPVALAACRRILGADAPTGDASSLTTAALAARLGVSCATLRRLAREPGAPVVHVGRSPRWDLATARAWLAARGSKAAAVSTVRPDADVDRLARRGGLRLAVR